MLARPFLEGKLLNSAAWEIEQYKNKNFDHCHHVWDM